ncbi:unnamed protein product [Rotaria magnacalcarata]|uniref:Uncharacterized protein n=1 Tax=Rotaria magnacalcarata TaxID=392030 RepID=A0A816YS22_9BILA|nr:unnamed protein product [Rotaria magnacalcarata]
MFDIDGIYNSQNDRIWVVKRLAADTNGGIRQKHHSPPSSPDLNPLDYCIWDELTYQVNWGAVTSKTTLINEVKCAVRKVSLDVVFESCSSWTNRLYRLPQVKGNYLR